MKQTYFKDDPMSMVQGDLAERLPVMATPDLLVCGLGCAGFAAATAAARLGLNVAAVEPSGFAGGFITAVSGPTLDGAFDVTTGERVVGGVVTEILTDVVGIPRADLRGRFRNGGQIPTGDLDVGKPEHESDSPHVGVLVDIEAFKLFADRTLTSAGVEVLYHTMACGVVREGGTVTGVLIASKAGLGLIRPSFIVDATGDADVVHWAGAPTRKSESPQPMTLHFRVGNVRITDSLLRNLAASLQRAVDDGRLDRFGGPWALQVGPGDLVFNATRITADRTDPHQWTRAEMEGREAAWEMVRTWRESVPEMAEAYYVTSGPEIGARETRTIVGEHTLTTNEILAGDGRPDAIARGAWYLDRHPEFRSGFHTHVPVAPYDIAYGTLVPVGLNNVLVAGRCHSANPEALASSRVTATAMSMGEGAAAAIASAVRAGLKDVRAVDVRSLNRELRDRGVIL